MSVSQTLIAFDFSGTLSLGAVAFGTDERLAAALKESGLSRLGVDSPEIYWRDIVEPTWEAASTSTKGYLVHMVRRVQAVCGSSVPEDQVRKAADAFMNLYLAASTIDPMWKPILQSLTAREHTFVVVATDHYAEATPAITDHLKDLGVAGKPLPSAAGTAPLSGLVLVANSADLGAWKMSFPFWKSIAGILPESIDHVLLVDDFGANEPAASLYADDEKIRIRRRQTLAALNGAFGAASEILSFAFPIDWHPFDPEAAGARSAKQIAALSSSILNFPHPGQYTAGNP